MRAQKATQIYPKRSQSNVADPDFRLCDYCGKPFTVDAQSRQLYHDPDTERRLATIRKKKLIELVTVWFWEHGCTARDMRAVATACVEAEPKAMRKAVECLGFQYDRRKRIWKRG